MLTNEALTRLMQQLREDMDGIAEHVYGRRGEPGTGIPGRLAELDSHSVEGLPERLLGIEADIELLGRAISVLVAGMRDTGLLSRRPGMPQVTVLAGQAPLWTE